MYSVQQASTNEELDAIYELRYDILRKPWQQPRGSERDALDGIAVNAFIADKNGKAIACGRLQQNFYAEPGRSPKEFGKIRYMAVDENFRGQGLAKMILKFLEKKALEMNLSTIELQAREN